MTKEAWRSPVDGTRCRGRQSLRIRDVVMRDTEVAEVVEGDAMDRT